MARYLFEFHYRMPKYWDGPVPSASGVEPRQALFVEAENSTQALDWGREVAQGYVQYLFELCNREDVLPSWRRAEFRHGIVKTQTEQYDALVLDRLPVVAAGEFPDFADWAERERDV